MSEILAAVAVTLLAVLLVSPLLAVFVWVLWGIGGLVYGVMDWLSDWVMYGRE